jgi:hypothetical protein
MADLQNERRDLSSGITMNAAFLVEGRQAQVGRVAFGKQAMGTTVATISIHDARLLHFARQRIITALWMNSVQFWTFWLM